MIALFSLASFTLGALGRRVAGGVLNQWFSLNIGDTPARLFYGLTVAVAALAGGLGWLVAGLLIPAVWVGTTTGNFAALAMGTDGSSLAEDWEGMSLHGFLSAVLPSLVVFFGDHDNSIGGLLVLLGVTFLASPSYYLGWRIAGHGAPWLPTGLKGGTEVAEALWGGLTALSVFLAGHVA